MIKMCIRDREGLFEPLDEALTTPAYDQDKTWGETFIPNLMESMKINGVSYFIPESMYTHGFFYDAAMFRELGLEVPNTWDDPVSYTHLDVYKRQQ